MTISSVPTNQTMPVFTSNPEDGGSPALVALSHQSRSFEAGDSSPFEFGIDDLFQTDETIAASSVLLEAKQANATPPSSSVPLRPLTTPPGTSSFATIDIKPKRPLSSYNYFFKEQRKRMIEVLPVRAEGKPRRSHGKIGFAEMARAIAYKWKRISSEERSIYDKISEADKKRYKEEMRLWKENNQITLKNELTTTTVAAGCASIPKTDLPIQSDPKPIHEFMTTIPPAPPAILEMDQVTLSLSTRLSEVRNRRAFLAGESFSGGAQLMESLGVEAGTGLVMNRNPEELQPLRNAVITSQFSPLSTERRKMPLMQIVEPLHTSYKSALASSSGAPVLSEPGSSSSSNAKVADPLLGTGCNEVNWLPEEESISTLANAIGNECCEFLINVFQTAQD